MPGTGDDPACRARREDLQRQVGLPRLRQVAGLALRWSSCLSCFRPLSPTTRECLMSAITSTFTGRPAATPTASQQWRCTADPAAAAARGGAGPLTRML